MEEHQSIRVTAAGFREVVMMWMTGQAAEHIVAPRSGSALALAQKVAQRCEDVCLDREVEMCEDVYAEVVGSMAPQFAPSG